MPVAVVCDYKDAEIEQYDDLIARLGFTPEGSGPPGVLFHWGTKTPAGVRTVEVWGERSDYDAYAEAQLRPAAAQAGLDEDPAVAFIPVHNHLTQA